MIINFLGIYCLYSQTSYYGNKDFGCLKMLNDTTCTLCFFSLSDNDTFDITVCNDTMILKGRIDNKLKIILHDTEQVAHSGCYDLCVIKYYWKTPEEKNIRLVYEQVAVYDTIMDRIIVNCPHIKINKNAIIVFHYLFFCFRTQWKGEAGFWQFSIDNVPNKLRHLVTLNDFMLLRRGNRLIPINEELQYQCWLDNGFYFPIMKKSKSQKSFKTIDRQTMGLRGLPTGYKIESPYEEIKNMSPKDITKTYKRMQKNLKSKSK